MTIPGQIRCGLSRAGCGIKIRRNTLSRLPSTKVTTILSLADGNVAGRKIDQHSRSGQRSISAWRDWRPYVLANLGVDCQARQVRCFKNQLISKRHPRTEADHFVPLCVARGGKLPLFIEFAIVGKVALGRKAEDSAAIN